MRRILCGVYAIAVIALPALGQARRDAAQYLNPVWSRDGKSIAFESNRDGKFAIYTIDFDGTNLRRLTSAQSDDVQPQFSPDGKRIVFVSGRDGRDQVYLMNVDGSDQRRLLGALTPRQDFYPSFSPDGRWIAFGGQDTVKRMLYSIHVVASDGSSYRALSDTSASAESPEWSRDGTRLHYSSVPLLDRHPGESGRDFVARRQAATRRMSVRIDGTDRRPDSTMVVNERFISPDGKWRFSAREGVPGAIYIVNWATGADRLLIGTPP